MAELFLRDDLAQAWRGRDPFAVAGSQPGETVRVAHARRTLRFETGGAVYYAKVHDGVGWGEIGKNLLGWKKPILGARNEYLACRRLAAVGIAAPRVAAYGCRGGNPARRRSFIVCDALTGRVSLEDVAMAWAQHPPAAKLRRRMVLAVADLARDLHAAGVAHRDFYLCHILADAEALARGEPRLAVIDLHRARTGRRVTRRWRLRDLAALRYSAAGIALSQQEELRFLARYSGLSPHAALRRHGALWRRVGRRAQRLAQRGAARGEDPAAAIEGRAMPLSITVRGANGAPASLQCLSVLRRVPGRRLVAYGFVDGRPAVVKCFFGRGAGRRCRAEQKGLRTMAGRGVGTAAPLDAGRCPGGFWSAAAWIAGQSPQLGGAGGPPPAGRSPQLGGAGGPPPAGRSPQPGRAGGPPPAGSPQPGGAGGPPPAERSPQPDDLAAVVDLTANMHQRGLLQQDPHSGNFVMARGAAFAVDGGGVRGGVATRLALRLGRRAGLGNLARLLAAFDVAAPAVEAQYGRYCTARGWTPRPAELRRLERRTRRAGRSRRRAYLKKTRRTCTEFEHRAGRQCDVVYRRTAMRPELERLLAAPDAAVAAGERLKDGNSATVVRVRDGAARYVVKRYNTKPRRARRAWRNGHWLGFRGIPTALPIALVMPHGRGPAYLVLQDLGDDRLDGHVARHGVDATVREGVEHLFDGLREEGLTHGDAKATNFIVYHGVVALVDLDALRRAWLPGDRHRDARRFAHNWEGAVAAAFTGCLGGAA